MKRVLAASLAIAALASTTPRARAAGYLVYDISAEALGKGSAVTASTREPAAIWFNPGALGFMPSGISASVGGTFATAAMSFEPAGGGFAQYVRALDWIVEAGTIAVPDSVAAEEAAFIEPVNTCLKAVGKAGIEAGVLMFNVESEAELEGFAHDLREMVGDASRAAERA